jgi:cytochrome c-type biogenesis protein CcmF
LVLYASFLTRSGILADTSVHSFGKSGIAFQFLIFLLSFLVLVIVMISMKIRKFHIPKQESLLSREFWMFIGSIIMVLASFQLIFTTSIPVFNFLFHTGIAPPADRVGFYNRYQMPFALLITGFIAFSQFLNYDFNDSRKFFRKVIIPLLLSMVVCISFMVAGIVTKFNFVLFLFFILFALFSSLYNLIFRTSNPRNLPAVFTHIGFVMFLLGALITFSNSKIISVNTSRFDLGDERANNENLMLVRGDTLYMGDFYVIYSGNRKTGNATSYRVDFLRKLTGKFQKAFTLQPSVNVHPRMGAVYNPDTRHFINRDYYTNISAVGHDPDYIVIKVTMNPYINIMWTGCFLMMGGFAWAFFRRVRRRWICR